MNKSSDPGRQKPSRAPDTLSIGKPRQLGLSGQRASKEMASPTEKNGELQRVLPEFPADNISAPTHEETTPNRGSTSLSETAGG